MNFVPLDLELTLDLELITQRACHFFNSSYVLLHMFLGSIFAFGPINLGSFTFSDPVPFKVFIFLILIIHLQCQFLIIPVLLFVFLGFLMKDNLRRQLLKL